MNIRFVTRPQPNLYWGGDLKVISTLCAGMNALGHSAQMVSTFADMRDADFIFLTSTGSDLRPIQRLIKQLGIPYGIIPFYEDFVRYCHSAEGLHFYVKSCLAGDADRGIPFSLDRLIRTPHILRYYSGIATRKDLIHEEVLSQARVCIANTEQEARTIRRDAPISRIAVIPIAPGFAEDFQGMALTDEFLHFAGLQSGEYILQVGRIQSRKNQLSSLLATRDLDIPLVFIATTSAFDDYTKTFLTALRTWRKGPTWVISQNLPDGCFGAHRFLRMPQGEKLSTSMLRSAFGHAGLHLHPAFYELPGATYFESALFGVPTIASSWTSIGEYFQNPPIDDRIEFCEPCDFQEITHLVQKKFGQKYPQEPLHPAFVRTGKTMARDVLSFL